MPRLLVCNLMLERDRSATDTPCFSWSSRLRAEQATNLVADLGVVVR